MDGFSGNGLGNERLLLFEQALYALISDTFEQNKRQHLLYSTTHKV
jgi:hypothetical protein